MDRANLQHVVDASVADGEAPGEVLAVSVHGSPPVVVASGVTDPKSKRPIRTGDTFAVASVTKGFVGLAALQLVDAGRLDLDAPIDRYIRYPNADRITVRELLNHTSGEPPETSEGTAGAPYAQEFQRTVFADLSRRFTLDEVLAQLAPHPLLFAPGTSTSYSNANTILLGKIVEVVSGQPLRVALQSMVFDPLGMRATEYAATAAPSVTPDAGVFTLNGTRGLVTSDFGSTSFISMLGPAGGAVSTADDLVRFANATFRDHRLLTPRSWRAAETIGPGGTGLALLGFGAYGFCVFQNGGCPRGATFPAVGLSGSLPGTNTTVLYDRQSDVAVVAIATSDEPDTSVIARLGLDLAEVAAATRG